MSDRRKLLVRGTALLPLLVALLWTLVRHEPPDAGAVAPVPGAPEVLHSADTPSSTLESSASVAVRTPGPRAASVPGATSSEKAGLEGTVRDAEDHPIAGAWVIAELRAPHDVGPQETQSDSEGHWRMSGLEAGALLLEVEARACGFSAARAEPRTPLVAGRSFAVDLVLASASGFCGRVLDARSNRPIAEVQVSLAGGGARWFGARAMTDEAGRFRLAAGLERRARVMVHKPGYACEAAEWEAASDAREVRLQPADANLSGIALLPDGSPAAEAFVNSSCAQGSVAFSTTDKAGRFRLVALPAGPARVFAFHSQGKGPKASTSILRELDLQPGENELSLQLEQPPGASLGGSVTREGRPAAGVRLVVEQQVPVGMQGGNLESRVVYSGGDGRFELHDLLPVHYLVQVETLDASVGLPRQYALDLTPGEVADQLDFRVSPGSFFKGKVLTPFGKGALTLEVWEPEAIAPLSQTLLDYRDQGFSLGPLPPVRYHLRLMDRDDLATELELGPESTSGIELLPLH